MDLNKKQKGTIIVCAVLYLIVIVLAFYANSGERYNVCIGIAAYINSVTALYYNGLKGRKSVVFVAILGLVVNATFLMLRFMGKFAAKSGLPSEEETIITILLIGLSLVWVYYSIKALHKKAPDEEV